MSRARQRSGRSRWPILPLGPLPLVSVPATGPTAAFNDLNLVLWPWLIAIGYLIAKELSLSC